jgi:hypothetical protein
MGLPDDQLFLIFPSDYPEQTRARGITLLFLCCIAPLSILPLLIPGLLALSSLRALVSQVAQQLLDSITLFLLLFAESACHYVISSQLN